MCQALTATIQLKWTRESYDVNTMLLILLATGPEWKEA